jgi:hypothetical protein
MMIQQYKHQWNQALRSLETDPPEICELRLQECLVSEKDMKRFQQRWIEIHEAYSLTYEIATAHSLGTILVEMVTASVGDADNPVLQRAGQDLQKILEALRQLPQSIESMDSIRRFRQRAPEDEMGEEERLQALRRELERQLHKGNHAGDSGNDA